MAFYFVTGKLGNGKTLCSIGRIKQKLIDGCIVASNVDLDLVSMFGSLTDKPRVLRVPDKPTAEDLYLLGNANESYDESKNGLLVLDECGTWFNARSWNDKTRKAVNDWFLHARKLGWDVILIVQDISIVDSQARSALSEHTVFCRRLDKLRIPFISPLIKTITGINLTLPKIHRAKVVYGDSLTDPVTDIWTFRGTDLYSCYDTKQAFISDYPHHVHSILTPWHTHGRYQVTKDYRYYMRLTKIHWKRFKSPVALSAGVLLGVSLSAGLLFADVISTQQKLKEGIKSTSVDAKSNSDSDDKDTDKQSSDLDIIDSKSLFISRLSSLTIVGSSSYSFSSGSSKIVYDFKLPDKDLLITSDQLSSSGVSISHFSDCHAQLLYGQISFDVYCL